MPKRQDQMRECCLTRQVRPVEDLIRFALGPDDVLVPDVDAKAPGRGAWVTLSEAAVAEAARRNAFSRSFRHKVSYQADLALVTRQRLEERLLGALGLARKAGQLVTGAAKVHSAITAGNVVALFTAKDAAPDGRNKMAGALKARFGSDVARHFEMLASDQLGLALGLENVIHAALVAGPAANGALTRAQRLSRYLSGQVETRTEKGAEGAPLQDEEDTAENE